jgi:hypothetical protein
MVLDYGKWLSHPKDGIRRRDEEVLDGIGDGRLRGMGETVRSLLSEVGGRVRITFLDYWQGIPSQVSGFGEIGPIHSISSNAYHSHSPFTKDKKDKKDKRRELWGANYP